MATKIDFRFLNLGADFEAGSGNAVQLSQAHRDTLTQATSASHAQNTDTRLGLGTADEITAAQLKSLYDTLSGLVANGKIVDSFIPALAISSVTVVGTIAERDLLSKQEGDVAVVTDSGDGSSKSYILDETAVWREIKAPNAAVTTVAGRVGDIVLVAGDIGLTTPSGFSALTLQEWATEVATQLGEHDAFIDSLGGGSGAELIGFNSVGSVNLIGQNTVQAAVTRLDSLMSETGDEVDALSGRQNFFREPKITLTALQIMTGSVTLSATPTSVDLVNLSVNGGALQNPGVDFTVATNVLSWLTFGLDGVLAENDILFIDFIRE